jgi:hypothetical protein
MKDKYIKEAEETKIKLDGQALTIKEKEELINNYSAPEHFTAQQNNLFDTFLDKLSKIEIISTMPEEFKNKINIGFIGGTCCGKSTLINVIAKKHVCKTGIDETTITSDPIFEIDNGKSKTVFWDFPGSNDKVNYLDLKLMAFDLICLLYETTPKSIFKIIKALISLKVIGRDKLALLAEFKRNDF